MRFALVTTTAHLVAVDLESRAVLPLESHRGEYYGISWFAGADELVCSHSGLNNADLVDIASYADSEKGWISAGTFNSRRFLSQPHQICCAGDGRVVCTNTGRNVITVLDPARPNTYQEAGLTEARWDRLSPEQAIGDHLNSVFLRGDRLFVIAHRHSKGSALGTFSYPELELLSIEPLDARTGLHNIWITGEGQRISCHSDAGSLIDLDARAALWESGAGGFTRGLAAGDDFVVVGDSRKSGRDLRRSSMSGLWLLDRRTWRTVDYICLGPFGCVNEVRLLDVPDHAHHGIPFAGLDRLLDRGPWQAPAQALAIERLESARLAHQAQALWSGYDQTLGSPETLPDGARRAGQDSLCLALCHREPSPPSLSFDYALDAQPGTAHVSAVLGYAGTGNDTNMAALLQPTGPSEAALSAWRHDGKEWSRLPDIDIDKLPLTGTLEVSSSPAEAVLKVDGRQRVRVSAATLGLEDCSRGLGIRWWGQASVRPRPVSA
jgi:hypothetical protein